MNRTPDVELVLREYLADDGLAAPDHVIDVVEGRIRRQRQRRSWPLHWRPDPMHRTITYAALAAAVVLVAIAGYNLLPRQASFGNPTPVPSAAPSGAPTGEPVPTPTRSPAPPVCDTGTTGCAGRLGEGTHSTSAFQPAMSFTTPNAWYNSRDVADVYFLHPPADNFSFLALSDVALPDRDDQCDGARREGAGNAVADWVDFLTTHPGLDAEAPVPVQVGGFDGFSIRFSRAGTWTTTCPNSVGPAIVTIVSGGDTPRRLHLVDDQQVTYWLLDVAGETVIVHLDSAPTPAAHLADLRTVQPVLESITFAP